MVRPKRTRSSTTGSSSTETTMTRGKSKQKKAKTSTDEKGAAAKPAPKKSRSTRSGPLETLRARSHESTAKSAIVDSLTIRCMRPSTASTRDTPTTLKMSEGGTPIDSAPADAPLDPVPTVGSVAPDFTVKDEGGNEVTLASLKGKNVVLYFYPKDNTPGCTKEAIKFRDLKAEYDALDCVILGVSADHETSHTKFIAKYELNFSLLADTNKALIKDYGATKPGDKIQRSTVIIDKEGKIAAVWNPVSGAETHPDFVLEKLKEIASAK